ncbi:MAG: imidazoleglycerol-phosphate dehydratase [Candidatus Omnitrophica bacterium]|nr:imidazoleglycerol-phosphate dehydratase [Candidatus Omnitrophota bacterium]
MERKAPVQRKSNETQIDGMLNVDGTGKTNIKTPIGLLSHMLELFAFHGYFDLDIDVKGDTHIDIHHTNEDIGIALGKAFKKALGDDKIGIKRFGSAFAPMEDTLGHSVVDISGRGHLKFNYPDRGMDMTSQAISTKGIINTLNPLSSVRAPGDQKDDYTFQHVEHFIDSFAKQLGANIIITIKNASLTDLHTIAETVFKSLGLALDMATTIDPRRAGKVPSTKGIID